MRSVYYASGAVVAVSIIATALLIASIPYIQRTASEVFPIKTGWVVQSARVAGADLIIEGTMIKHFACEYISPPRARDLNGVNYLVESHNTSKGKSWAASKEPQTWGPWRVFGGADKILLYYQQDRCHPLWDNFFNAGRFRWSTHVADNHRRL